jgi:hypothetical protein
MPGQRPPTSQPVSETVSTISKDQGSREDGPPIINTPASHVANLQHLSNFRVKNKRFDQCLSFLDGSEIEEGLFEPLGEKARA